MGFYLNIYSKAENRVIKSATINFILNQIFTSKSQILIDESKSLILEIPQKGFTREFNPYSFLPYHYNNI
jgi:hypothetical protein